MIVDTDGKPLVAPKQRAASYSGASTTSRTIANWQPPLVSKDYAILPEKGVASARTDDLIRNNGFRKGALDAKKNQLVGHRYKLRLSPNWRVLGVDKTLAYEWASKVEAEFSLYADSSDCWIDAQRRRNFVMLLRAVAAAKSQRGEAFLIRQWRRSPLGIGTCFTVPSSERVSTPINLVGGYGDHTEIELTNGNRVRDGVEFDSYGAMVAIYVCERHPKDIGFKVQTPGDWTRVPVFNRYGWRQVTHIVEMDSYEQTRGIPFGVASLSKAKMVDNFAELRLQAWQLVTQFAMYVETDGGRARAEDILGAETPDELDALTRLAIAEAQHAYYGNDGVRVNGVQIPVLMPGDRLAAVQRNFDDKDVESQLRWLQREQAADIGMSYESYTKDYSQTTYSSARASASVEYQGILCERATAIDLAANQIFRAWFDEAVMQGIIEPLVPYTPSSGIENSRAFEAMTKATWIGSGKTVIDELKQSKANSEALNNYQLDPFSIAADNGQDLEEIIEANRRFNELLAENNLTRFNDSAISNQNTPLDQNALESN